MNKKTRHIFGCAAVHFSFYSAYTVGVRVFGFAVPCDIKLSANDELDQARDWVID